MNSKLWFEEPDELVSAEEFKYCNDCPGPNGCITRCGIEEYKKANNNVAEQRGETPEQLVGLV